MPAIIHPSCVTDRRRGVALLMVLLIVLAVTIVSTGFLARADVEMACGENMALRTQMDQLADSALEHAKGLLLHPQDVPSAYWTGTTQLQLIDGSRDYYDVQIVRDACEPSDYCTYNVTCEAYRLRGAEKTGSSRLSAQLRLDPCIALWTGGDLVHRAGWLCHGDVRCSGTVTVIAPGAIDGDVFSAGLTGSATGAHRTPDDLSLTWPPLTAAYFHPEYAVFPISPGTLSDTVYQPARIWSCTGDLTLGNNVTIEGMLFVQGNLTINGTGNSVTAAKNLPAVYASGNLIFRSASDVQINGLVVVDGDVFIGADTANGSITGGLFAARQVAETAVDSSGNGNDAVIHSQPVWRPAGGHDGSGALDFDGIDNYLQTPDSLAALQLTDEYTLSVWVQPAAVQKDWATLLTKTDPDGLDNHWTLQFEKPATTLVVRHPTGPWDTEITLGQLTADGAWHHVAIVRQADGTMLSYLDGALHKTMDPNDTFKNRVPGFGDGHLNIGADRTVSTDYVYKGSIDEIRIYSRALTLAEVNTPPNDPSSLIGHWRLDEAGSQITIAAEPAKAAIFLWPDRHWSPAAGAFFKSIRRQ